MAALLLWGCFGGRTTVPIGTIAHPASPDVRAQRLFVLLPGFGDGPEAFDTHGFVAPLHALGADAIAVDSHFGYYRKGIVFEGVWIDVIAPARARGTEVWLVGVSMGGSGALETARRHPGAVTGVILLAPYLGRKRVLEEIAEAGGPGSWSPATGDSRWDVRLWTWLADPTNEHPELYLGHGESDQGRGVTLLAELIPERRRFVVPGGHGWTTWAALWNQIVPVLDGG